MKLSELVDLYNGLSTLGWADVKTQADAQAQKIIHELNRGADPVLDNLQQAQHNVHVIQETFDRLETDLDQVKDKIKQLISQQEPAWLQKSYAFYEMTLKNGDSQRPEAVTYNRNRRVLISPQTEAFLCARVRRYNSWQYPSMIIHPMHEPFIHELLGNDPLYLVDESPYLIEPVLEQFNPLYQRRLRCYHIQESFDYPILDKLPNGQFGFCLAYNYLNFRPFEIIKKYLNEVMQKLRPGGVFAFTFNDCERSKAIVLVEQNFGCYTPSYLVEQLAETMGFEIIFKWNDGGPSTWIELKRPGQLETLRGGQSLAKILPKPIAESK